MDFINKTLGQVINENGIKYADRTAIKYTTNSYERTWKELDEETDRIAK